MSTPKRAPPATLVVFGATGDLTRRLLAPALVNLHEAGLLDDRLKLIGIGHSDGSGHELRDALGEFVEDKDAYGWLRDRVTYVEGDFTSPDLFKEIAGELKGAAVFYLAVAAKFFGPIVDSLGEAGLLDEHDGFRRVVIEKPFGSDLASAHALNEKILKRAGEEQIYRIDHFLGKETVQNMMILRFGNPLIEAVWNNRYVDSVQITAAEVVSVGSRGAFYDGTGALRDMVPNHLFQLLALVGMEPPNSFTAEAIRTEKAKAVDAVRPVDPADAVRGRYGAGEAGGQKVEPYAATKDVAKDSTTETYVALKVLMDTWRWTGVPFYLRTGKALTARDTEIVLTFKDRALALFQGSDIDALPPNQIRLQIQPNEGLSLGFTVKMPGPVLEATPVAMTFRYADRFKLAGQTGYETLLYDVLVGDQTLFQRADQIEGGWRAVQPLLDAWKADGAPEDYPAGSAGPKGADELLARDGRAWGAIG